MPPQLREIGCHVQNHATQWHGFQHEIQLQEIVVAWIKMTPICEVTVHMVVLQMGSASGERMHAKKCRMHVKKDSMCKNGEKLFLSSCFLRLINHPCNIGVWRTVYRMPSGGESICLLFTGHLYQLM